MDDIKRVIALGFFDGVHLGHQLLMHTTVQRAAEYGVRPAVMSFDTHPDIFVFGKDVPLLGSVADRKALIRSIGGIEDVIMIHFDEAFMHLPWEAFLNSVKNDMGAVHLVIGSDFSCGYRGLGKADVIADWCKENDMGIDIIDKLEIDDHIVSSTLIRDLISAGDMETARKYLGHPHSLTDTVGYGYKIGRKIGAPTINTRIPEGVIIPRFGVYATKVWLPDGPKAAVTNVGIRPTFNGDGHVTVESNILDFNGRLYGSQVKLDFLKFLRDERKFDSPELLAEQIQKDIAQTKIYFSSAE